MGAKGAAFDSTLRIFGFDLDTEAALDAVGHEYTHGVINSIVGHGLAGGGLGTGTESEALEEHTATSSAASSRTSPTPADGWSRRTGQVIPTGI